MNSGKTRALLRWHRRAGKDKACWCYMIYRAAMEPGNYYYFFPLTSQGRMALWETRDGNGLTAVDHIPEELGAKINSQEMKVEIPTPNGQSSIIRVIGLDKNTDYKRGISCKGAIFSEFAYQGQDAYKVVMPSIRESKGWAIFNSTPQGMDHFYEMEQAALESIEKHGEASQWYFSHLQAMWPDQENYSGLLTQDDLDEDQRTLKYTDDDMAREYGASYVSGKKGSIYGDHIQAAREEGRVGAYPYDNLYPVHTYHDPGYNDAYAIWYVQYIEGTRRVIDFWEDSKKDIPTVVREALAAKPYKYLIHHLPHDAEQNTGLAETKRSLMEKSLTAYGVSGYVEVHPKTQQREKDIILCQDIFSQYHFNAVTCQDGLEKLALYHFKWDAKKRIHMSTPVHDFSSHCADALRLEAVQGTNWVAPIKLQQSKESQDYDVLDW